MSGCWFLDFESVRLYCSIFAKRCSSLTLAAASVNLNRRRVEKAAVENTFARFSYRCVRYLCVVCRVSLSRDTVFIVCRGCVVLRVHFQGSVVYIFA